MAHGATLLLTRRGPVPCAQRHFCSPEGGQVLLFCDGAEYYGNSSHSLTTQEMATIMCRSLPAVRKSVSVTYLGLGSDAHLPWMGKIAAILGGSLVCGCGPYGPTLTRLPGVASLQLTRGSHHTTQPRSRTACNGVLWLRGVPWLRPLDEPPYDGGVSTCVDWWVPPWPSPLPLHPFSMQTFAQNAEDVPLALEEYVHPPLPLPYLPPSPTCPC
jgi:hypothetical protein